LNKEKEKAVKLIPAICHGCKYGYYNCGMLFHVENGRIMKVEGDPYHPLNRGRLCAKGLAAAQWVHSTQRLKYPLKRIGEKGEGKFKRISWEEALDTITERIKEIREKYGPETIATAKGQASGWFALYHMLQDRFAHAGIGTPNASLRLGSQVCYVPQLTYYLLTVGGNMSGGGNLYPQADYENADLIIEWFTGGQNGVARRAVATIDQNLVTMPAIILDRLEKGAELKVINPQLIPLAGNRRGDWIPIKPGTDGALALAMINVVLKKGLYDKEFVAKWCDGFDELKEHVQQYTPQWAEEVTGIPAQKIEDLATKYATTKRACIRHTESPEKADLGSFSRSVAILIAITGHLDREGGNVWFYPAKRLRLDTLAARIPREIMDKKLGDDVPRAKLLMNRASLYPELADGMLTGKPYKIGSLIIFSSNPMNTARDTQFVAQWLKSLDFTVIFEIKATPTCRYADIVLPAAAREECGMEPCYSRNHFILDNKVIEPPWETRNENEVILELGCRLGNPEDFWNGNYEEMIKDYLKGSGITLDELKEKKEGIYLPEPEWMKRRERYEEHFKMLPGSKVQLYNRALEKFGFDPLPIFKGEPESPRNAPELSKEYPLIFTDEHATYTTHQSWMRDVPWLRKIRKHSPAKMNPKTAEVYGIEHGDWIEIESPHGKMKAVAWIYPGIVPGVMMGQHGWWEACKELDLPEYGTTNGGTEVNVLYSWKYNDPFAITSISKNTLVKIKKASPPKEITPVEL
jgi:anaerobic selenocysteine-containing dehydrogenase